MRCIAFLGLVTFASVAAACDSQAGPDYQGEPLATLTGTVVNSLDGSPGELDAALVWVNSAGSPDVVTGVRVPVAGSFPASFQLAIYEPPADEMLNDLTAGGELPEESRIGVAYFAAVPTDFDLGDPGSEEEPDTFGVAERHVLVYVESDIQPGSLGEQLLGAPLPSGFHVMDVIDVDDPACPDEVFDCLRAAPGGLDTSIEIRIDEPEALDVPNWT